VILDSSGLKMNAAKYAVLSFLLASLLIHEHMQDNKASSIFWFYFANILWAYIPVVFPCIYVVSKIHRRKGCYMCTIVGETATNGLILSFINQIHENEIWNLKEPVIRAYFIILQLNIEYFVWYLNSDVYHMCIHKYGALKTSEK